MLLARWGIGAAGANGSNFCPYTERRRGIVIHVVDHAGVAQLY